MEKPGIIWTLYIPGNIEDLKAGYAAYFEMPDGESTSFASGYEATEGTQAYVALSTDTWEHWDSFEEMGQYFSTRTSLPVYGIAISKNGGIDLVFHHGKRKKFNHLPLTQYDFGIQLGCRIDRLKPIVLFRNFWRAVIVMGATMEAWSAATNLPGFTTNPCVRIVQLALGILIHCDYTRDELGKALWIVDENLPDHGLLNRMFPKHTFCYLTHNKDLSNFIYAEKKGFNTIRIHNSPSKFVEDSDAITMDHVLGETEPLKILEKLGVPPEVLGY